MSHNNSPDNELVYNTPTQDLFPIFPYDNQPQNYQPQDLFPVFPYYNPPANTPPEVLFPPVNNLPGNNPPQNNQPAIYPPQNQPNTFGLTDEKLYEQDITVNNNLVVFNIQT
jgi:hypothetical protein